MVGNNKFAVSMLSKILFNHPNEGDGNSYIDRNIFQKARSGYKATKIAFVLITRAHQLSISDFERVGLGQEVNNEVIRLLKEHILDTVEQVLRDYGYIASAGTKLFRNSLINKLNYKAIEKMHVATSIYLDNAYLSFEDVSRFLELPDDITSYLTKGRVITEDAIKKSTDIIYGFITNKLYESAYNPSMKELQIYYDAIDALKTLSRSVDFVKTADKIRKDPSKEYKTLWYDENYKAWNVLTQLQDLFGTEPLSFGSLDDKIFDGKRDTGLFDPHHINPKGKESLALYDQILTDGDYHNTYKTMSEASQRILKEGVRKLIQIGIDEKRNINEDDIKKVFYGKVFTVKSRATKTTETNIPILSDYYIDSTGKKVASSLGLWDYHFSTVDFNTKLGDFNKKIKKFRDTLQQTGSQKEAYMAVLSFKYQIALTRFYDKAGEFANFMKLGAHLKPKDPNYLKLDIFGNYRHLHFTKLLYKLTIPLTSF